MRAPTDHELAPDVDDATTDPEDHTADWAPHDNIGDDPGSEVVDLDDDDAPKPAELEDVPALMSDGAPYAGDRAMWSEYEWATWLAPVLRRAGVKVIEYPGWQLRGRPRTVGPFRPRGVMWHHDASARGPSPGLASFIAVIGRPAEGIPAPLAQVWVCAGCGEHEVGTWHLLAAGRANHAGAGAGWGAIPEDAGATYTIGIETDNTTGERTPKKMRESLVLGTAAILNHLRSRPGQWLTAHKEYAEGRKIDPDDIGMKEARTDVRRAMHRLDDDDDDQGDDADRPLVEFPGRDAFKIGKPHDAVEQLRRWLLKLPAGQNLQPKVKHPRLFTAGMRTAVRTFQENHDALDGDADGKPGPLTWELIQRAARRDS